MFWEWWRVVLDFGSYHQNELKSLLDMTKLMSNRQNELKSLLGMLKVMSNRQNELKSLLDVSKTMWNRQKVKTYRISIVNLPTLKLKFNWVISYLSFNVCLVTTLYYRDLIWLFFYITQYYGLNLQHQFSHPNVISHTYFPYSTLNHTPNEIFRTSRT